MARLDVDNIEFNEVMGEIQAYWPGFEIGNDRKFWWSFFTPLTQDEAFVCMAEVVKRIPKQWRPNVSDFEAVRPRKTNQPDAFEPLPMVSKEQFQRGAMFLKEIRQGYAWMDEKRAKK